MKYFEDLAGIEGVKGRSKSRVIYDAFKIKDLLARAASNQAFTKAFTFEPVVQPGNTLVKLQLTPTAGGGENMAQMELPESNYQRTLRKIAADPNGVALFQVMPDAFATYLEARLIADDNRVAATWETLSKLDITMNINGYTTQRFAEEAAARPRGDTPIIRGPAKTLD